MTIVPRILCFPNPLPLVSVTILILPYHTVTISLRHMAHDSLGYVQRMHQDSGTHSNPDVQVQFSHALLHSKYDVLLLVFYPAIYHQDIFKNKLMYCLFSEFHCITDDVGRKLKLSWCGFRLLKKKYAFSLNLVHYFSWYFLVSSKILKFGNFVLHYQILEHFPLPFRVKGSTKR